MCAKVLPVTYTLSLTHLFLSWRQSQCLFLLMLPSLWEVLHIYQIANTLGVFCLTMKTLFWEYLLKSTCSSLILHNLGYLEFNDIQIILFALLNFPNYLALPLLLYTCWVCWLMFIRRQYQWVFIFTTPFLWEPVFKLSLEHLSLVHTLSDYTQMFIYIHKMLMMRGNVNIKR